MATATFSLQSRFPSISVDDNGDEIGGRLGAFTRNPLSSPFSFTDPRFHMFS